MIGNKVRIFLATDLPEELYIDPDPRCDAIKKFLAETSAHVWPHRPRRRAERRKRESKPTSAELQKQWMREKQEKYRRQHHGRPGDTAHK